MSPTLYHTQHHPSLTPQTTPNQKKTQPPPPTNNQIAKAALLDWRAMDPTSATDSPAAVAAILALLFAVGCLGLPVLGGYLRAVRAMDRCVSACRCVCMSVYVSMYVCEGGGAGHGSVGACVLVVFTFWGLHSM